MRKLLKLLDVRTYSRKEKVQFFMNIIIGVGIALLFFLAEETTRGGAIIDSIFDGLITIEANAIREENSGFSKTYCWLSGLDKNEINTSYIRFIEVGRPTLEEWDGLRYPVIPRDKTAELLREISAANPKLVIVDILYDTTGCKGDRILVNTLREILKNRKTKFIFPALIDPATGTLVVPFFYKELKKEFPEKVFIASFYFLSSRYDGISRFINFYRFYTKENGEKGLIWNVSILAPVIYFDSLEELRKLKGKILHGHASNLEIELGERKVEIVNNDIIANRIRFVFPVVMDKTGSLTLRELPIHSYELSKKKKELTGKVVILGTADPLKGDFHRTPIGSMPGMYVIGNAIYSATHFQILHESIWIKLGIELFVILLAAYLSHWFNFIPATFFSLVIIGAGIPLTVYMFFRFSLFINIIFPMLGIILHKDVAEFEKFFEEGLWKKYS